jgi:hypothetical protein
MLDITTYHRTKSQISHRNGGKKIKKSKMRKIAGKGHPAY